MIKTKTIDFFDNTVLKYFLFPFNNNNVNKHKKNTSLMPLSIYVQQLKRNIDSSKNFIRSIIEHIRYKGKIKIITQSNNNPTHSQNQSSFPEIDKIVTKVNNTQDDYHPFDRFDDTFDAEKRTKILNINSHFRDKMHKSIDKSYYNNFFNENKWQVLDALNTFDNIRFITKKFQEQYAYLKLSNKLEDSFMMDSNPFLFIIDDHIIPINSRKKMIEDFKSIIPNFDNQILISNYANKKFLRQAYLQVVSEHPEINQYELINSKHSYQVNHLYDGSIKLVVTHRSDLDIKNNHNSSAKQYTSFGVRATVIFPPHRAPIMKYSYFLN